MFSFLKRLIKPEETVWPDDGPSELELLKHQLSLQQHHMDNLKAMINGYNGVLEPEQKERATIGYEKGLKKLQELKQRVFVLQNEKRSAEIDELIKEVTS